MKPIIKKILREYVENRTEKDDFMMYVDYTQKKAIKNSNYPEETKKLDKLKDKLQKRVKTAYMNVTGEKPVSDDNIIVKVDDNIKKGKIGSFVHPENEKDIGIMKVHPDALEDKEYVEDIIKHELIHAAHGVENETARKHGGVFQKVADKVGLPKKYRH